MLGLVAVWRVRVSAVLPGVKICAAYSVGGVPPLRRSGALNSSSHLSSLLSLSLLFILLSRCAQHAFSQQKKFKIYTQLTKFS